MSSLISEDFNTCILSALSIRGFCPWVVWRQELYPRTQSPAEYSQVLQPPEPVAHRSFQPRYPTRSEKIRTLPEHATLQVPQLLRRGHNQLGMEDNWRPS